MGDARVSSATRNPACAFFLTVKDGIAELVFDLPERRSTS